MSRDGTGLRGPHFINVDLEVWSRTDLRVLADALRDKGFLLHDGKIRRKFMVCFEAGMCGPSSPEKRIWELLDVVGALPLAARRAWKAADSRVFSVGYSGGEFVTVLRERPVGSGRWFAADPKRAARACETSLSPKLVAAVARVGGTISTTIYPPTREETGRRSARAR